MSKQALGKGLSALIADSIDSTETKNINKLLISKLVPGSFQPRGIFDEESLKELAASIKENGVIQPIVVRERALNESYQIIAGERRWRASKLAGLKEVPVIIRDISDKEALEFALAENIQRQSLTPIEEAEGYKRLIEEFSYTQEQLAENMGKSRSHVSNMLRILQLPDEVKDMLNKGSLTMGHARALINANEPVTLAKEIVKGGLSVREAEKFAAGSGKRGGGVKGTPVTKKKNKTANSSKAVAITPLSSGEKDDDLVALEQSLSDSIGLPVTIEDSEEGGAVSIYFSNLSELDIIMQKLGS